MPPEASMYKLMKYSLFWKKNFNVQSRPFRALKAAVETCRRILHLELWKPELVLLPRSVLRPEFRSLPCPATLHTLFKYLKCSKIWYTIFDELFNHYGSVYQKRVNSTRMSKSYASTASCNTSCATLLDSFLTVPFLWFLKKAQISLIFFISTAWLCILIMTYMLFWTL